MPSLLESLTQAFPSDVLGQIGKVVGANPDLVSKGLGTVGPVLVSALANKAATPGGLDSLIQMLPSGGGPSGLGFGDLLGLLKPGGSKSVLSNIFGLGTGPIGATLDKSLGFDAAPLLATAAPVVLGLVSKAMHSQNLDKAGVAKLLQDEKNAFFAKGGEAATLAQQALDAGREATTLKDKYTTDEWEQIRMGPVAAAHVVMMASPSGVVGTVQEVGSVLEAMREGKKSAAPTGLLNVAFGNELSKDEFVQVAKGKSASAVLDLLRGAVATVAAKNPTEVASYKSFVLGTAQKTAEAAKEGGFLGIGGTKVSKEEQAALDQIRSVLGT